MPATATTNWTTTPSDFPNFFDGTTWPLASSDLPPETAPLFRGVRSCLLKYSDEVSRRIGVACLERAMSNKLDYRKPTLDSESRFERPR